MINFRLAFAITTHKIQGQSILAPSKVVVDIESSWGPAMVYVMLSRVQRLDQIYILGKFNPKKISCIKASLEETERLERISINRNPTPWNAAIKGSINVASLNCMGLRAHHQDMLADVKLMKADVLQLSETSLTTESNLEALQFPGFKSYHTVVANGKGISSYYKETTVPNHQMEDFKGADFQVSVLSLPRVDCINVYRSSTASLVVTADAILERIKDDQPTLIMGDFNVCTVKQPNNSITRRLLDLGFSQLMTDATHIRGGHIDHIYWRDSVVPAFKDPVVERYSPYYSDHDCLLVTLLNRS